MIKEEPVDSNPATGRKVRPRAGDKLLEIDDNGSFRELSTTSLPQRKREIIEISDDDDRLESEGDVLKVTMF